MPLNFAAVEHRYAAGGDAAGELTALVAAAHEHDIEVWLDVVFNHTTEIDETGPTYNLRGLADRSYYRLAEDGSYLEASGCGNDLDITSAVARGLVQWSLDRLADHGIDGFRFDLAAVLARDRGPGVARFGVAPVERPVPRRRSGVPPGRRGAGASAAAADAGQPEPVRCAAAECQLRRLPRRVHPV
jgi:hypothetical protein